MFKLVLADSEVIRNSIPIIAEIIDEGVFKIGQNGLSLLSPDRTMVAVVDFHIPSSAFEEFRVEGTKELGLNMTSLVDVVKRVKSSDKLIIQAGKENTVNFLIEGKAKRKFELSLLDIHAEKPPIDQLKFHGRIELKSEVMEESIADADIVSDSVVLQAAPDSFRMSAKGDTTSVEVDLKKGDEGVASIEVHDKIRARYPMEYLKKMIKAGKLSDTVVLEFGTDYPMRLSFTAVDKVSLKFILAPRVED